MQREREMRGIALEEIAKATKIGTRSLRALEEEDFDKLPGGIFNKGFVRAYAKYLGIDEEQAVADYVVAFGEAEKQADAFDSEHLKKLEEHWKAAQTGRQSSDFQIRVPWGGLLFLLILAGAAFAGWHYRHQEIAWVRHHVQAQQQLPAQEAPAVTVPDTPAESTAPLPNADTVPATQGAATPPSTAGTSAAPAVAALPPPAVAASTPAATPASKPDTEPRPAGAAPKPPQALQSPEAVTPAPGTLALKIHARQQSWVQIKVDGALFQQGELIPGRNVIVSAKKSIYLKTGNAGGLELSFNGQAVPALGQEKEVKSITFGPNGVQPASQ
jgi:cytoskeleton protein RodZ